jgi:methionyl-tRNA synthetase
MEILLLFSENLEHVTLAVFESDMLKWSVIVFTIFDVSWKAIALWRAGRMGMIEWFVVLFFVNSLGILPIVFILFTRKKYNTFVYGTPEPVPVRIDE